MSDVRIVLDRHEGGLWGWVLTYKGDQFVSPRLLPTALAAAEAAETHRSLVNLFKDSRRSRPQPEAI